MFLWLASHVMLVSFGAFHLSLAVASCPEADDQAHDDYKKRYSHSDCNLDTRS